MSPCSRGANERRLIETRTSGWQMEVSLLLGWFVFQGIVHSRNCLPCLTHVCNHCCKTLMRSHRLSPRFLRELSAFLQPMLFIDDGRGLECSRGLACFSEHFVEGALGIAELLLHRQRRQLQLRPAPRPEGLSRTSPRLSSRRLSPFFFFLLFIFFINSHYYY